MVPTKKRNQELKAETKNKRQNENSQKKSLRDFWLELKKTDEDIALATIDANHQLAFVNFTLVPLLHYVLRHNRLKIAALLLQINPSLLHVRSARGKSVFHHAAKSDEAWKLISEYCVQRSINMKSELMHKDKNNEIPIHTAIRASQIRIMKAMLNMSPELIGMQDGKGNSLLHFATRCNATEAVRYLCRYSPLLFHIKSSRKETPLAFACSYDIEASFQVLYQFDRAFSGPPRCNSWMEYAISHNATNIVRFLYQHEPSLIDVKDKNNQNLLFSCCSVDMLQFVLSLRPHWIHERDKYYKTIFYHVASISRWSLIPFLIDTQPQLLYETHNRRQKNAVQICLNQWYRHKKEELSQCLECFLKHDPYVVYGDQNEDSPLHIATQCSQNRDLFVSLLAKFEGWLETKNKQQQTPFETAFWCNNRNAMEVFLPKLSLDHLFASSLHRLSLRDYVIAKVEIDQYLFKDLLYLVFEYCGPLNVGT